jgi:multidrug efflux pump subunit AcrB
VKYKFYRIAVLVMIVALLSLLIALILYPVCFASELSQGNRTIWEFGWAYGVGGFNLFKFANFRQLIRNFFLGWGAAIFLFGAVVLLLCDKESEEIYYKERKIVHESSQIRD